jgi:hypothetical protein
MRIRLARLSLNPNPGGPSPRPSCRAAQQHFAKGGEGSDVSEEEGGEDPSDQGLLEVSPPPSAVLGRVGSGASAMDGVSSPETEGDGGWRVA